MLQRTKLYAGALVLLASLTACSYNKLEDLNPAPCNTDGTTYRQHILPVMENICYSCHAGANANISGGGINLEGHAAVQTWALNGELVKVLQHAPGVPAMPEGQPKLDNCTIARFQAWVAAGAPNN